MPFDFSGLEPQTPQQGSQAAQPDTIPGFDFDGLTKAPTPAKTSTTPKASPPDTVKFDFEGQERPSYKITLEGTRPGDLAATGQKTTVAPNLHREVAQSMADVLVPKLKDKFPKINPKDGKPYTQPGHMPMAGDSPEQTPGTHTDFRTGIVLDDEGLWEKEMKPGWQNIVAGVKELFGSPDHRMHGANTALMGALTMGKTPLMMLGLATGPAELVAGTAVGMGTSEVVERVGEKVGADEDFTHLAANIAGLYAGGKGVGLVRGFESVATQAAATEAAAARAVTLRAERERLLPGARTREAQASPGSGEDTITPRGAAYVRPADVTSRDTIAADQAAKDRVLSRLGQFGAQVAQRRADLTSAADRLTAMSVSGEVRALPAPPTPPQQTPVFTVDMPLGTVAAPAASVASEPMARTAKKIVTEIEEPALPEGMTLTHIQGTDSFLVSYMSPLGPVSSMVSAAEADIKLPAMARAFRERTQFPKTFGELPVLEKSELRRVRMELEEFQHEATANQEDMEDMFGQGPNARTLAEERAAREGNLKRVTAGSGVLHDINDVRGGTGKAEKARYTRNVLAAAIRKFEAGGKLTAPVRDALIVARRRLGDTTLEGFSDTENPIRHHLQLPEDAGARAEDTAHIPGFDELADRRAYLEAERDAYYQQTAVRKVVQYLGEAEDRPRGVQTTQGVLKATPEVVLANRERLRALKADPRAWKALSPDARKALQSQLDYLDQALTPAMVESWVRQGKPGLTIFPERSAEVIAENPVAADVLPEPGRVGVSLAEIGQPGELFPSEERPVQPNPEATPPPPNAEQQPLRPEVPNVGRPFDEPTVRTHVPVRDIGFLRTLAGPVEQTLLNHPLTQKIAARLLRAVDEGDIWLAKYSRRMQATHKGLSRGQRMEYSEILNKFENPADAAGHYSKRLGRLYSEDAIAGAIDARNVLREIWEQIPGNAQAPSGGLPQYIKAYLTHIDKMSPDNADLRSGIIQLWDSWYGGVWHDIQGLFTKGELERVGPDGKQIPARPLGVGRPKSRFLEHRTGDMKDIELDPRVIWPIYLKSVARVIIDKPALDEVRPLAEKLPANMGEASSHLRDLTTKVIRNFSRYDAYPSLQQAWKTATQILTKAVVASFLGLSPRLYLLHFARIQGVYAEMPNSYFWKYGLKATMASPLKAFDRTAQAGLLPNQIMPWEYRSGSKLATVLNAFDFADFFDRSVAMHGFEKMYLDQGYTPAEAYMKAVARTKKVVQHTDRVRVTFPVAMDNELARATLLFKAVPARIVGQMVETARLAKTDPERFARHVGIVTAMLALENPGGVARTVGRPDVGAKLDATVGKHHLIHVGSQLLNMEYAVVSEARKVIQALEKGDWEKALQEAVLLMTPAGKSLETTWHHLSPQTQRAVKKTLGFKQALPPGSTGGQ